MWMNYSMLSGKIKQKLI